MKKTLLILSSVLFLGLGSTLAQNNDNGYIGRARGAASSCLNNYTGPDWIVNEFVGVVGSCFVDGFITQVSFSARPANYTPCINEEPCSPPPLPIIVATVTFGCDGEIIENSCY